MALLPTQLLKPNSWESTLGSLKACLPLIHPIQSIHKSCLSYLPHTSCIWPFLSTSVPPFWAHHHQFLSGLLQIPSKMAFFLSPPPPAPHSTAGSYCVLGSPASDPPWPSCVLRRKFRILFVSVTSTVGRIVSP